ncbi:MAG: NADH-quinone oxidoreductase subunit B, partial [Sphingobacteriales bacterium]
MPRPVQYNTNDKVKLVDLPEGYAGEGFYATSFDKVVG